VAWGYSSAKWQNSNFAKSMMAAAAMTFWTLCLFYSVLYQMAWQLLSNTLSRVRSAKFKMGPPPSWKSKISRRPAWLRKVLSESHKIFLVNAKWQLVCKTETSAIFRKSKWRQLSFWQSIISYNHQTITDLFAWIYVSKSLSTYSFMQNERQKQQV
jgi:hypothetical protein